MQDHRDHQDRPWEIFTKNPDIETLVHVTAIWKTDTNLTVDVYARGKGSSGRKAVEAVRDAIADLLHEWNVPQPDTQRPKYLVRPIVPLGGEEPDYLHYRVPDWSLNIPRPGG